MPVGAFLRLKEAIPFEAPDGKPVNLLFFVLVPEKATEAHLQILAALAGNALPGGIIGDIAKTAVLALVDKLPGKASK